MPHCHSSCCHNTCCDSSSVCESHCSGARRLVGFHLPKDPICAHTHCHDSLPEVVSICTAYTIPPPEVITTTFTYTVPPPVVEYEKVTTSVALLPQPPVTFTEVRRSSLRCVSQARSCPFCRSRSRSSSYHCRWSVGCAFECLFFCDLRGCAAFVFSTMYFRASMTEAMRC